MLCFKETPELYIMFTNMLFTGPVHNLLLESMVSRKSELLVRLRPYVYSYFQPSRPPSSKLADMFTEVECFFWQSAGPATSWLMAAQDSETATRDP